MAGGFRGSRGAAMNPNLSPTLITSAVVFAVFVVGLVAGFLFFVWRERARRAGLEEQGKGILEGARREAESIARDARLAANEQALKLRSETEAIIAARHKELAITEQRLVTREELVNGQLENLVSQEKAVRLEREALVRKSAEIQQAQEEALKLVADRRAELAKL